MSARFFNQEKPVKYVGQKAADGAKKIIDARFKDRFARHDECSDAGKRRSGWTL